MDRVWNCEFDKLGAATDFAEAICSHEDVRNVLVQRVDFTPSFTTIWRAE
jgi:hypothetical protein